MLFGEAIVKQRRIHFIGIGGIGMSGIAEILLNLGYKISGSDLNRSPITERLGRMGATVFEGHAAEHILGADVIVYSSAIARSNPEFAAARAGGIPTVMRGELLAELMRLKFGIAVAGSHGKTTTTSMTAAVLHGAAKDPTVVVGGRVGQMGSNARVGKSDYLLVEADESDGSFLKLAPILAVITNVDREHLDHYSSEQAIEDAFVEFANKAPFYGSAIVCIDDPVIRRLLPRIERRVRTYGESADADLRVSDIRSEGLVSRFRLTLDGADLGEFEVQSVGRHNALNATAAALVGLELDASADEVRDGLRGFIGVDRRFQLRGRRDNVAVVDDYGHHPTEIAATLAAAQSCGFNRVHVLFQPHRYSRTELLAEEFAGCFGGCSTLTVVDVYAAGEAARPGTDSPSLTKRIQAVSKPEAVYAASMEKAVERVAELARPGDMIMTLGAGNVWRAGDSILQRLELRSGVATGD